MITKRINNLIDNIINNEVVCIPTDTIYGLSCTIDKNSIKKLIKLKQRDPSKSFIIVSHNPKHLLKYVDESKLSKEQLGIISTKQESPTTWIVPANEKAKVIIKDKDTVAIRLVDTQVITEICSKLNDAIISTSANISGEDYINDLEQINKDFPSLLILQSQILHSNPSKIFDIITNTRIR